MSQINVKKPYLLYVGNAFPHKNLKRLIRAFRVVLSSKSSLKLVLVGKIDDFYKSFQVLCKELKIEKSVIFAGKISDKDLKWLYQNALIYVFPSFLEGFGLPGLEAMEMVCQLFLLIVLVCRKYMAMQFYILILKIQKKWLKLF